MTKWYDRIGNTIEMRIGNQWVKGTITNGYRTHDGLINMKTEDDMNYWCGVNGEYIYFRKCDDSLGDLISNSERIKSMSDEELAKWLTSITDDAQSDAATRCDYQWLEWLREEIDNT
jgi:hypothetical protein